MTRPATKQDLIEAASGQYDKLMRMIDAMTEEEQNAAFDLGPAIGNKKEPHWTRDKNLRDVLIHLHEWHHMVKVWYDVGTVNGGMPAVPGTGYTWATLPLLNQKIWERYQNVPLADAKKILFDSHTMIMNIIGSHTNDELFSKGVYKWTKTTTLGSYLISVTSSHYEWAMTKIKIHIRTLKEQNGR